jgi:glyoxylase-like metal-dependent hydrolase (beta-lactamase superfamily II)
MTITRRGALMGSGALVAGFSASASLALAQEAAKPAAAAAPAQAPGFYRYKVGDIEVIAVNDGYIERPVEGYVKNAPLAEVQQFIQSLNQPAGKVRVPYTAMVLRTGGKTVLIDTGMADMGAPTQGRLAANLKAAGIEPAQIDVVVISHFHGDHINGLRTKAGELVYPKAEVMVPEAEYAFWMDDARMAAAADAQKGLFAIPRRALGNLASKVTRFAADKEILPGITALPAYGHTPGHTTFAIHSGNQRMMMMVDVTNHTGVFLRNPDWHVLFDMEPDAAAKSRRRMAELAVSEKMQVAFYHAPFPATGFIEKAGNGFRLEPVQWT